MDASATVAAARNFETKKQVAKSQTDNETAH
jgi:hypothetical protein